MPIPMSITFTTSWIVLLAICVCQCFLFFVWTQRNGEPHPATVKYYGDTRHDSFYSRMKPIMFPESPNTIRVLDACAPKTYACCLVVGDRNNSLGVANRIGDIFTTHVPELRGRTFMFHLEPGTHLSKDTNPPHTAVLLGSPLRRAYFPRQSFTHIVCPGTTINQFDAADRRRLLGNLYFWLKPGGTLIVQSAPPNTLESYLTVSGNYNNVAYQSQAQYHATETPHFTVVERFSGKHTPSREHEYILFYAPPDQVRTEALKAGFTVHSSTESILLATRE